MHANLLFTHAVLSGTPLLVHISLLRAFRIRPNELSVLAWSWLGFFCLLASYYILRPLREQMAVAGGVQNLQWLFSLTLVAILITNLPLAALAGRLSRRRLISSTYLFFIVSLVLFVPLLGFGSGAVWLGRVFFVWISVFNLFAVSIFWTVMVDLFDAEQGGRLFGLISAGGTLGALTGSALTVMLAHQMPIHFLLFLSSLLLVVVVYALRRLPTKRRRDAAPVKGPVWSGLTHTLSHPYLAGIAGYVMLSTVISTLIYFEQAKIVGAQSNLAQVQTSLFAQIDLWSNLLTLVFQFALTSRIVKWCGVGLTLAILPAVSLLGFVALVLSPTLVMLILFQVLQRSTDFSIAKPARELLFTVVSREDKFKAKSFIDTVVYRLGDQIGAWSHLGAASIYWVVPLCLLWLALGGWLGVRQKALRPE